MIGMMDWGIGGLSVYKALREAKKNSDVLYFSDSGFTPYGKLQRQDLRNRLNQIAGFFKNQKIKKVLVACNAASSALESDIEKLMGIEFFSIIPSGVAIAQSSLAKKIGVIGGDLTIQSKLYEKRLKKNDCIYSFVSAQSLSAIVESGNLDSNQVEDSIKEVFRQLKEPESVLLACTHYPALIPIMKKLRPQWEFMDPASQMVTLVHENGHGSLQFFTSGSVESSAIAAKRAFGIDIKIVNSWLSV